jgi:acyl-CoA synthetase (AMP-forming)/AMP-acid ligase II/acyl carrier protein
VEVVSERKGEPMIDSAFRSPVRELLSRAREKPDSIAHIFLSDGETTEQKLTYGQLDRMARVLGNHLRSTLGAGERALLLYPPGLEFIVAMYGAFYGGVIAVPTYPPDPRRLAKTLPRLEAIIADSGSKVILTTRNIALLAEGISEVAPGLRDLSWIATDDDAIQASDAEPVLPTEDQVAFLQYTSGSTGSPKGVMVSHKNLMANILSLVEHHRATEKSTVVSWLPQYHDMGLIGGILGTPYFGGRSVLLSPLDFLQKPIRWLRAIQKYKGDVTTSPNFGYDLCVRKTTAEERAGLDLSSLEHALNGAEVIRSDTLASFSRAFAPSRLSPTAFKPVYGLAEATLMVTDTPLGAAPATVHASQESVAKGRIQKVSADAKGKMTFVSSGRGINTEVLIVDAATRRPCEAFDVGEIWIRGQSVALGYWGAKERSEETFGARLANGDGPFLRTGDLGFMEGADLFITGRSKDLIIVRGRNYYPTDLESTAEHSHSALRRGCSAAFSIPGADGEEVVLVSVLDALDGVTAAAVAQHVYQVVLVEHDLALQHVVFVRPAAIQKTTSGKLMRSAMRDAFLSSALEPVTTWQCPADPPEGVAPASKKDDPLRTWMIAWLAQRLKVSVERIDPKQSFTSYGLNSMAAVKFADALSAKLKHKVPAVVFFDYPTVDALAAHLEASGLAKGKK